MNYIIEFFWTHSSHTVLERSVRNITRTCRQQPIQLGTSVVQERNDDFLQSGKVCWWEQCRVGWTRR
jgi:hypothetical protein